MKTKYLYTCLISLSIVSVLITNIGYTKEPLATGKITSQGPYLETKNFKIYIKDSCPLYATVCGNVLYTAISKQNPKNKITLNGTTLNDGNQYAFQGYIFKNGNYTYSLPPKEDKDLNSWSLKVTKTDKDGNEHILSQDDGEWKYDEQHPAPSYNLYGYTFDSGALHYTIRYFANAQVFYGMLQKSNSYVINEDIIKTSE